jgi:glycosyltransferase involved in cell wall biosynthesis
VAERVAEPLDHPWAALGAPPLVLAVGRLAEVKDFPTLLRAFACVRAVRPARLVILGEGREREALEALAAGLGLGPDVLLMPGYDPNPLRWMARAAVLVSSSRWEGMPGVLIEAMAAGCPVVATDCPGGSAEILEHGRLGRLVPVGDDAAMAAAILATLAAAPDREALRARAGIFGAERAVEGYLACLARVARPQAWPERAKEEA